MFLFLPLCKIYTLKTSRVISPTQSLVQSFDAPTVFLAGSIEMDQAEDWQTTVIEILQDRFILFNPRRSQWDASWEQSIHNPTFKGQVDWELNALTKADYILFYFSPGTKSPVSLLELGLFASTGKLVVCCPDGFWRKGNVEIVCERYSIPFTSNLNDSIQVLLSMHQKAFVK